VTNVNLTPITRRVRAFFAPVDRTTETPASFDASAPFELDSPPAPWTGLGDIVNFARTGATKISPLIAGARGAVAGQFRGALQARVAFDFLQWGKIQMALAGGSQHTNVLATDAAGGSGTGNPTLPPVAVLAGSTASELILGLGAVDAFSTGDLLACDVDYQQQTGYIGSPIAAAYVKDAADVNRDRDYLRRVTFNVARVSAKTTTPLLLDQPLAGGAPATGASAQRVVAFADHEGGSFFQEWSALFVAEAESGGTVSFYYPKVQACAGAAETELEFDPFRASALHVELAALPVTDALDGEQVVCYRVYSPETSA
jgi:hypothetical protein